MTHETSVFYRPATDADSYTVFNIFEHSLADLLRRLGSKTITSAANPKKLARMWEERKSLYTHLANTADQFWIAEQDGKTIGFSRSILRSDRHQLTELFLLPDQQSGGVGRQLFNRALPLDSAKRRSIIASPDIRAQVLYLKSGVYPRFPVYYFGREPEKFDIPSDLTFEPIEASPDTLKTLAMLDEALLGFQRHEDHQWLLSDRQGYFYLRGGTTVGYGYLGKRSGPFGLLEAADFPAVLAHAESQAVAQGKSHFGLEVPMINQTAVDHLLRRGFRIDEVTAVIMTDKPFGRFENYIVTSPPFFI